MRVRVRVYVCVYVCVCGVCVCVVVVDVVVAVAVAAVMAIVDDVVAVVVCRSFIILVHIGLSWRRARSFGDCVALCGFGRTACVAARLCQPECPSAKMLRP